MDRLKMVNRAFKKAGMSEMTEQEFKVIFNFPLYTGPVQRKIKELIKNNLVCKKIN